MKKKHSNVIDPEWVRSSGQPIRHEMLRTMLMQHGFECERQTSGSHHKYSHPLLDEPVVLVGGTTDVRYNKIAATACTKVIELEKQRRQAEIDRHRQSATTTEFRSAADQSFLIKTLEHIPDDIDAFEFEGVVVMRSKRMLQTGTIIATEVTADELEQACASLNEKVTERLHQLGEMQRDYEAEFHFDGDMLHVSHPRYGLHDQMEAYNLDREVTFPEFLTRFTALMDSYDFLFRDNITDNVKLFRKGEGSKLVEHDNGDQEWTLVSISPFSRQECQYHLVCSPQSRMEPRAFFKFLDDSFQQEMGGRLLANALHNSTGCEIKRPRKPGTKKAGDLIVVTHPFFPDYEETYICPDTLPSTRMIWDKMQTAQEGYDEHDIFNLIYGVISTRSEIYRGYTHVLRSLTDRLADLADDWDRRVTQPAQRLGLSTALFATKRLTEEDLGKVHDMFFGNVKTKQGVTVRAFLTDTGTAHFFPEDFAKAEDHIREVHAKQVLEGIKDPPQLY